MKRMLFFVGTFAGAFVIWALYGTKMWPFAPCSDITKTEVVSPDGSYTAVISERDCGATTDYSTMVSLRQSGSVFKIGGNDKNIVLILEGQHSIGLKWKSNNNLWVMFPAGGQIATTDIFKKQPSWGSVVITYKGAPDK